LQIRLWVEWWEQHKQLFDLDEFLGQIPESLYEDFAEMFKFARESNAAQSIIGDLLSEGGSLDDDEIIRSEVGSDFF
jgi:hypothetical protein